MAKKAYVGVDGKARKIKKGYVGVTTEFPVYGDPVSTSVTVSNIAEFFDVKNDTHYFKGSGGTFANTNGGVDDSTAKTTLTAKVDMEVSFYYSYSTEPNYDKFTLVVGTTTVEKEASGAKTTKSYSGNLSVGESIVFTYTKDGSQAGNDDRCAFSTIVVKSAPIVGTETKGVARKIKKAYIGIGGVASAENVIEMMLAGATAVEVGAANLVNPYVCKEIIEQLPAVMEKYGVKTLKDIIGGAH